MLPLLPERILRRFPCGGRVPPAIRVIGQDLGNLALDFLQSISSIVVIDLVLSGDNAIVIGMAARNLSPENRHRAILWGGAGAVVLRIAFTVAAALLLHVALIQAIGGVLLLIIAYKLATPGEEREGERPDAPHPPRVRAAESLRQAVATIILADAVMSLDNILAVGGAAEGHLVLLLFGLGLSIPILLFGSNLVAAVMQQHPWLLILGVLVLIHSAVQMILEDTVVRDLMHAAVPGWEMLLVTGILTALLLGAVKLRHGGIAGITGSPLGEA